MRRYLTRREVADQYPISYSTLAHLAMKGKGPPYSRIGKKVIYEDVAVHRWIQSHLINTSVDMPHRVRRPRKFGTG
jgi:predicted DNA-binding transcriptional regulator AlpA